MKKGLAKLRTYLARFRTYLLTNSLSSTVHFIAVSIAIITLLVLSATVIVFQWNQITRAASIPSNANAQSEQILSEAQQDVTVANDVITWSGFFLAFIASSVAIAGFFGLREYRHIQHLRTEIAKDSQEVRKLKDDVRDELDKLAKRFGRESQTFLEVAYNSGAANDAYKLGDNKSAVKYCLQVLKLQPENTHIMERLGRAYSNLNQRPDAISHLEKALEIDPDYEPAIRSLALCYRYSEPMKAIDKLKLALAKKPDDHEAADFLGLLYRDNGKIDEAIQAHEQALAFKKRPETQFYLSLLYAKTGRKKDSLRMALNAEADLEVKDPNEEMRPVWQIIIRAGVPILEGDELKAYELIETLTEHITTQRTCDALTGHLRFLLEATGHSAWIGKFTSILKVK